MRIQYMSDLHMELYDNSRYIKAKEFEANGDVLVLAGDSCIDAWIYGHSHTNIDTTIGNTKIVCNQMGYVFSNEHLTNGFESGKVIELKKDRL